MWKEKEKWAILCWRLERKKWRSSKVSGLWRLPCILEMFELLGEWDNDENEEKRDEKSMGHGFSYRNPGSSGIMQLTGVLDCIAWHMEQCLQRSCPTLQMISSRRNVSGPDSSSEHGNSINMIPLEEGTANSQKVSKQQQTVWDGNDGAVGVWLTSRDGKSQRCVRESRMLLD